MNNYNVKQKRTEFYIITDTEQEPLNRIPKFEKSSDGEIICRNKIWFHDLIALHGNPFISLSLGLSLVLSISPSISISLSPPSFSPSITLLFNSEKRKVNGENAL